VRFYAICPATSVIHTLSLHDALPILEWKAVYVASAIVYTDVPEKIRGYIKQQKRWKKGYIRSNFYVSSFFWQKNPVISLIFYTRSEEHTSELQSRENLVCRLLLEKKK